MSEVVESIEPPLADVEMLRKLVMRAAGEAWKAALVAACIGALGGYVADERKPARGALLFGLAGGALGLSGAMAWNSREALKATASDAVNNVRAARDARWLSKNPIPYG